MYALIINTQDEKKLQAFEITLNNLLKDIPEITEREIIKDPSKWTNDLTVLEENLERLEQIILPVKNQTASILSFLKSNDENINPRVKKLFEAIFDITDFKTNDDKVTEVIANVEIVRKAVVDDNLTPLRESKKLETFNEWYDKYESALKSLQENKVPREIVDIWTGMVFQMGGRATLKTRKRLCGILGLKGRKNTSKNTEIQKKYPTLLYGVATQHIRNVKERKQNANDVLFTLKVIQEKLSRVLGYFRDKDAWSTTREEFRISANFRWKKPSKQISLKTSKIWRKRSTNIYFTQR